MPSKLLKIILVSGALLSGGIAYAQNAAGVDPVQYIVAPETPGPNTAVTITVQGVGTFLGDADISWSINGAVKQHGVGAGTFTFTTAGLGTQSTVRLSISSATQGQISHTFTFVPSTINLVWEADTSVPPLYQGHALYSAGSALKVIAFPTVIIAGKKVAAQSLSYQWQVGDEPQPQSSGTGKYILAYAGNGLNDSEQVAVDVYFGSLKVGRGEVVIPASNPQLLVYNQDPLRGVVWDRALPARAELTAKEITLFAQPYFFANDSVRAGQLDWSWLLNGTLATGPQSSQGILTLRQSGTGQGSADISVDVQNQDSDKLVQDAKAALSFIFGAPADNSLFGL